MRLNLNANLNANLIYILIISRSSGTTKRSVSKETQQNINLLRSAVFANRAVLARLKAAESEESSAKHSSLPQEERIARDQFVDEIARASNFNENVLISMQDNISWETVLLRSFESLSKEPAASDTLTSAIPRQIVVGREAEEACTSNRQNFNDTKQKDPPKEVDEEIAVFLNEWTNTSEMKINTCLESLAQQERAEIPGIPRWIEDEYN